MSEKNPQPSSLETGSLPEGGEQLVYDTAEEKRLLRKLDRWIVPPIMLMYLLSFLDRVNIGNARLYGLEKELNMRGNQFQLAVSILSVTYVLADIPSNLIIRRVGASRWLSFITFGWGVVATLTGVVQSFGGLIACRLLLGAFEGGMFPGLTMYLTFFYTKRELALRMGYLFVSSAIAGSTGGLLAYGIGFMDGTSGQRAWRWIMIIEGLPTVVLGVLIWWWLADDPATAHFLTPRERAIVQQRLARQTGYTASSEAVHRRDVRAGFLDWKVWVFAVAQFGSNVVLYGYSTFLPTIIKGLGHWSTAQIQCLTVPCYALGAIVFLVTAYLSDRHQLRMPYIVGVGMVTVIGYAILVSDASGGVKYFACFLVAAGFYLIVGIPLAWLPGNNPRYGKRTVATGIQTSIANISGISTPFMYRTSDSPRYTLGHSVTLAMITMTLILHFGMGLWFRRVNQNRDAGKEDHATDGLSEEEIEELGEHNPAYRYMCSSYIAKMVRNKDRIFVSINFRQGISTTPEGRELGYARFHWGIWVQNKGSEGPGHTFEVMEEDVYQNVPDSGGWAFRERGADWANLVLRILIGKLPGKIGAAQVRDLLKSLPLPRTEAVPTENCVSWVQAAIAVLQQNGWAERFDIRTFMDTALEASAKLVDGGVFPGKKGLRNCTERPFEEKDNVE